MYPSPVDDNPEQPILTELDMLPTLDETTTVILTLKNDEATGSDAIPAEILHSVGAVVSRAILVKE